jgi:hypothetical protein
MVLLRPDIQVATLALLLGSAPLLAGPVGTASALPAGPVAVLDIGEGDACAEASLPGARCLPADWILDGGRGEPIGFHALRWLLGTVGLSGTETLVVHSGSAPAEDAWAVAGLVYLAGQREVLVWAGETSYGGGGETRSFSRETVYTAAMRTERMAVQEAPGDMRMRLTDFAKNGGVIAFAPRS